MDIQITPHPLAGHVTPPSSKSMAHRLLIAAALAGGVSTLENFALSQDVEATLRCLSALGGKWREIRPGTVEITGIGRGRPAPAKLPLLDCGESGSTLRFFIPIALAVAGGGIFTGHGRLMERSQEPYFDLFREQGIHFHQEGQTLTIQGRPRPGTYHLPGNVSSQFFTGLLFALPLLDRPSEIIPTTPVESWDYILMTLDALAGAGVVATEPQPCRNAFSVSPASYLPFSRQVEADWSQAAFWYAAAFLEQPVRLHGLYPRSIQGDKVITRLYWKLARPGEREIDVSSCPDLLPPLAVMAAASAGVTRFTGAARLRLKESDRIASTAAMLRALGGQAEEGVDSLTVPGGAAFTGGTVDGANDHRIVMAAAIAATRASGPVTILGAQAVKKSYPAFWDDYQRLGGVIHVL